MMEGRIRAEWDRLRKVIVHKPDIEMFFGLLDPSASLYERAFNQTAALKEHDRFVAAPPQMSSRSMLKDSAKG